MKITHTNLFEYRRYFLPLCLVLVAGAGLFGCGGGGDDGGGGVALPPGPPALPAIQSGSFKDSNVSGLDFVSGQQMGTTDALGRFTCETGTNIALSIGGVALGEAECTTIVMPPSLVASGALDDVETLNRARFLLMLDDDGNPDNGIVISDAVRQAAGNWAQVDFTTANLNNALSTIMAEAANADGTPHNIPDATTALNHLESSLACAYAGAFAGPFTGSISGAMTMLVGWGGPGSGFRPRGFDWRGFDPAEEFFVGGGGFPFVELSSRPTIDTTNIPGLAGPINAQYTTPDRISGTWASTGVSGTFDIARLGDHSGTFRYLGEFNNFESSGVIALNIEGSAVTGEGFERFGAQKFSITGTLNGNALSFTATSGATTATFTGSATIAADGSPNDVTGTWNDGTNTGTFNLTGCRLN